MPNPNDQATSWTLFRALSEAAGEEDLERAAMNQLVERYYDAVLQLVKRIPGMAVDAEDVTHKFFEHKVLKSRGLFHRANAERGKFRSLLGTSVRHFVMDEFRSRKRERLIDHPDSDERGWEQLPAASSDDDLIRKYWLRTIVGNAIAQTEAICNERGQQQHFQLFVSRHLQGASWGDAAAPFSISETIARSRAQTVAAHFKLVIRTLIASDPACERDVNNEIRDLLAGM